jgi:hypothetical protein
MAYSFVEDFLNNFTKILGGVLPVEILEEIHVHDHEKPSEAHDFLVTYSCLGCVDSLAPSVINQSYKILN